jgi:hypothetical protein
MHRKRRNWLILFGFLIIIGALLALNSRNLWTGSTSDGRCKFKWVRGGTALQVELTVVLEDGSPVSGQDIDVGTDSGSNTGVTDAKGRVTITVGEPDVEYLRVPNAGEVKWPWGGISARRGLKVSVVLRKE